MDGKQGIQEVNRNKELLPKNNQQKQKNKQTKKPPTKTRLWETQKLRKLGQKRRAREKKKT